MLSMLTHLPYPPNFILQWHVTERCNWHCKHCYQEDNSQDELTTEQLLDVVRQLVFMTEQWGLPQRRVRLSLTGGEPFIRKDFMELLEATCRQTRFRVTILSNGSMLTPEIVRRLKAMGVSNYQVSIEGLEQYNDFIRGPGAFQKTVAGIKLLRQAGIEVQVSLTMTRENLGQIPALCEQMIDLDVGHINTRRLVPLGSGASLEGGILTPQEVKAYYESATLKNYQYSQQGSRFRIALGCESGINNEQQIFPGALKHHCGVRDGRLLVLMANGDVVLCRRLPLVIGNVKKNSLFEIFYSSNLYWELRNLNNVHPSCRKCTNYQECFGGAVCMSHAYFGKAHVPDFQCWKFWKELAPKDYFSTYVEPIDEGVTLIHAAGGRDDNLLGQRSMFRMTRPR
jgi:radical SAM protein with 4Fe4S-binding SPASM domain